MANLSQAIAKDLDQYYATRAAKTKGRPRFFEEVDAALAAQAKGTHVMSTEAIAIMLPDDDPSGGPQTVETEFGQLVYTAKGWLSMSDLQAVMAAAPATAVMVCGVAHTFNAFMAICDPSKAESWIAHAAQYAKDASGGDPQLEWVLGPYTGVSSESIFSVLSDKKGLLWLSNPARVRKFEVGVPRDPDDFSRCHDLLQKMPGWAERIGEVGATYEIWKPFSDNWAALTALYLEETAAGAQCPRLYERLQELREQSDTIQRNKLRKALGE